MEALEAWARSKPRMAASTASFAVYNVLDDKLGEVNHKFAKLGIFFDQSCYIDVLTIAPEWWKISAALVAMGRGMCMSHSYLRESLRSRPQMPHCYPKRFARSLQPRVSTAGGLRQPIDEAAGPCFDIAPRA